MPQPKKKSALSKRRPRVVPRQGEERRLLRHGHGYKWFGDLYVSLLGMAWPSFSGVVALLYTLFNLAFALVYHFFGGVENMRPGSFQDAFFFSVQTMATIGCGKMVPESLLANIVVTIEAFWGFAFFAVTTGIVFARFSLPRARVLFSNVAVISPYNGIPHLKIRLANQRENGIIEPSANLVMLISEKTKEGHEMRRFVDLPLVRSQMPLMQMTWNVMHKIDETSPLSGMTREKLGALETEIILSVVGMDETTSQTIHARCSYSADEVIFDSFFEDIFTRHEDGGLEIDYQRFHAFRPVAPTDDVTPL